MYPYGNTAAPCFLVLKGACTLVLTLFLFHALNGMLSVCRHLAAMKQRELENARVTAEEMEKQMAPLRYCIVL